MAIRLDMIGITVEDINRSIRFYRELGLKISEPDGGPYHEVVLEGGVRLSWNHIDMVRQIDPDYVAPVGQRIGLAFLCDGPGAVDATYKSLTEGGFAGHNEPWDAFWGQRYAQVQDPDGNVVDLFAPINN